MSDVWAAPALNTHVTEDLVDDVRSAFRQTRTLALLDALGHGIQMFEFELHELLTSSSLEFAEGEFLSGWLALFGERKDGLSHEEAHMVLRGAQVARRCDQSVDSRIAVLRELTGGKVEHETYPTGGQAFCVWRSTYMRPAHRRAVARIFNSTRDGGVPDHVVEALAVGYFGFSERTTPPYPAFGVPARRLL